MGNLNKILRWGNLLLILFTFITYLSPYISPSTFWPFQILGLSYPILLVFHLMFIFIWIGLKQRYFLFSLATLLLGWGHLTALVGFNGSAVADEKNSIQLMSYNINTFTRVVKDMIAENERAKNVFEQFFKEQGELPLICLQETTKFGRQYLGRRLKYPHHYGSKGTSILSKYPFQKTGTITFGDSYNSCVWVDIKIKGKTFRVYNIHFQSNRVSDDTHEISSDGNLMERETWRTIKDVIGKVGRASRKREAQAKKVLEHMDACPHPFIICGDFNDTPLSYNYRQFDSQLQDGFRLRGQGIGNSYNGPIPGLRIDYVFGSGEVEILEYVTHDVPFSDHFPITMKFSF